MPFGPALHAIAAAAPKAAPWAAKLAGFAKNAIPAAIGSGITSGLERSVQASLGGKVEGALGNRYSAGYRSAGGTHSGAAMLQRGQQSFLRGQQGRQLAAAKELRTQEHQYDLDRLAAAAELEAERDARLQGYAKELAELRAGLRPEDSSFLERLFSFLDRDPPPSGPETVRTGPSGRRRGAGARGRGRDPEHRWIRPPSGGYSGRGRRRF